MMMKSVFVLASILSSAYGHALIVSATGANGVTTAGFGVAPEGTVPRNGTSEQPFQLDTPVLKNLVDDPCGATLMGGSINIQTSMKTALAQGSGSLPSVSSNGSISMTLHQVNADGGGPFSAMVNTDATGKTWVNALVTQQPPGANGLIRGGPVNSQLTAQLPSGTTCTGGTSGDVCLIRINNGGNGAVQGASFANGAGPFGGCLAVTTGTGSSNSSTAATGTAAATDTAAAANATATATTTTTKNSKSNKSNKANKAKVEVRSREVIGRLFPSLLRREADLEALVSKKRALDAEIQAKARELQERQLLTVDLMDELSTAIGTGVDIPIDALAGQADDAAQGGNSTTAKNSVLTLQQAVDVKAALRTTIDNVLGALAANQNASLSTANGFAFTGNVTTDVVAQANQAAAKALAAGQTTSINAGNAGVGEVNTAVVNSLLGQASDVKTITNGLSLLGSGFTTTAAAAAGAATTTAAGDSAATATATDTAAIATATSTTKSGKKNKANKNTQRNSLNKRLFRSRAVAAGLDDRQ